MDKRMNAKDVMTTEVVSVSPDTPTSKIARLLLEKGISAVPVVDAGGAPIGMVSEGDLIGRNDRDREARRDWWLAMLAEGEALNPDFLGQLRAQERTARDVMAAPIVSIAEETDIHEIARLLVAHRVKRVPVVRDGRIVGIVSRADLLRAFAASQAGATTAPAAPHGAGFFAWVDRAYHNHRAAAADLSSAAGAAAVEEERMPAAGFRALVRDHQRGEAQHREEAHRAAAEHRQQAIKELIDHHIGDESWRAMLHNARLVAERGQTELMLLRFPAQLCSDSGRAINAMDSNWPATLRGEAAELYLRGEHELRPNGFHLAARVLDYPGGMPGDIGLFLSWGE
jgi:CBS domain-containing protein